MRLRRRIKLRRRTLRGVLTQKIDYKQFMSTEPTFLANVKTYAWYEQDDGMCMVAVKDGKAHASTALSLVDIIYGDMDRDGQIRSVQEQRQRVVRNILGKA